MSAVHQPIQDYIGQSRVRNDVMPVCQRQLSGDDGRMRVVRQSSISSKSRVAESVSVSPWEDEKPE